MLHFPIAALALAVMAGTAQAQAIVDPFNDILPTYSVGPVNGDLDVITAVTFYDAQAQLFTFSATLADDIGITPGALYVWGLDRGQGTERFVAGSPSIGAGVFFDSVLIVRPDGTGQFNDFINGTQTALSAGSVKISGHTVAAQDLPLSLFPSTGFNPVDYTWNLWPRVGLGANNQITDFAPDAANVGLLVTAVPEPETWAMLGAGLLLTALRLRRRA